MAGGCAPGSDLKQEHRRPIRTWLWFLRPCSQFSATDTHFDSLFSRGSRKSLSSPSVLSPRLSRLVLVRCARHLLPRYMVLPQIIHIVDCGVWSSKPSRPVCRSKAMAENLVTKLKSSSHKSHPFRSLSS